MISCPNCQGRPFVIETRHDHNSNTRRRFQCSACRYRWTEWNGDAPPAAAPQALDEAAIRDILTSTETQVIIAERYGRSASTIGQIQRGEMHANVAPELPRKNGKGKRGIRRVCSNCIHWAANHCDLGFPDPKEEGVRFARECSSYTPQAA